MTAFLICNALFHSMDSSIVKQLRSQLGLTQQAFASLLELSFVSVKKWEIGGSSPTGLSAVLLELLANALRMHPVPDVLHRLRSFGLNIKPVGIFVDSDGRCIVIDLGLAALVAKTHGS